MCVRAFSLIFGSKEARVEFSMSRALTEENKFMFDTLFSQKNDIEALYGEPLEWLRLDAKKASRIQLSKPIDGYDKDNWPEIINWMVDNMSSLEAALKTKLVTLNKQLKQGVVNG